MKCCNLASLDPSQQARSIHGLKNASRLDKEIWDAFKSDPEVIGFESEVAFSVYAQTQPRTTDIVEWDDVQGLDKQMVTKVRVNQHLFRATILAGYRFECAVCRLPIPGLLVAAHIVPWSVDRSQRMNPRNGVCLCSLHDRAFDTGVLIIDADFRISIHANISQTYSKNSSVARFLFDYSGETIHLPDRWHPEPDLLRRHIELQGIASSFVD